MTVDLTGGTATAASSRVADAWSALSTVRDPELDEPVTDLGFVRSVDVDPAAGEVRVRLRLPTSFCAPNFAYLMASDAKDALAALPWAGRVTVELCDHHDSELINRGLAADAGYRGTFGHEADQDLESLRATFRGKAHTAAMERCLTALLRADPERTPASLAGVRLADLPAGELTDALLRRRSALGLPDDPAALVLVDGAGSPCPPEQASLLLRRARATRVSIDGNAHFCRGLLRTRYPGAEAQQRPRSAGAEPADASYDPTFIPLSTLTEQTAREHP